MNTQNQSLRYTRGFTMMEILLVVAILGILAAILTPVLQSAREKGKQAVCAQNLHNIGIALAAYAGDWRLRLPGDPYDTPADIIRGGFNDDNLRVLIPDYTDSQVIFTCPSVRGKHKINTIDDLQQSAGAGNSWVGMSYEYNNYFDLRWGMTPLEAQGSIPVLHDTDNDMTIDMVDGFDNHARAKGGNCLFPDGSVEFIKSEDWTSRVYR